MGASGSKTNGTDIQDAAAPQNLEVSFKSALDEFILLKQDAEVQKVQRVLLKYMAARDKYDEGFKQYYATIKDEKKKQTLMYNHKRLLNEPEFYLQAGGTSSRKKRGKKLCN